MWIPSITTAASDNVAASGRTRVPRPYGFGRRRMTRSTTPRLPASRPVNTTTVSPLRMSGTRVGRLAATPRAITGPPVRGRRSSCGWGAARVALVVDEHGSVLVETDVAAIGAAVFLGRAHDDGPDHVALLDGGVRNGLLDAGDDHVADAGRRLLRAAHDPDHRDRAGAR